MLRCKPSRVHSAPRTLRGKRVSPHCKGGLSSHAVHVFKMVERRASKDQKGVLEFELLLVKGMRAKAAFLSIQTQCSIDFETTATLCDEN